MFSLVHGDASSQLQQLPNASVHFILTDPPYPEINRPYGRMSESEWLEYMMRVVGDIRRVLWPYGSAVLILQPNSRVVGSMRTWLWDFLSWVAKDWNVIQDVYWWNTCALPNGGANCADLLRPSIKYCVWLGSPDCYRDQKAVLWEESQSNRIARTVGRAGVNKRPSGLSVDEHASRIAAERRGGTTPFNLIPVGNGGNHFGHPAATPLALCDWWVRYCCPSGGTVLDPFCGCGTVGEAALRHGSKFIGIEKENQYLEVARARLAAVQRRIAPTDFEDPNEGERRAA